MKKKRVADRLEEIEAIAREAQSHCRTQQRLKDFTSLGVGGPIAAIVYPESLIGAAQLAYRLDQSGIRWRVLGHGTKILASESQHDYVAISLRLLNERLIIDGDRIYVHAGYSLPALVDAAAERGLSGLEPLAGITGSVGGALRMNIGLPGCVIWRLVENLVIAQAGGVRNVPEPGEVLEIALACLTDRDLILAATLRLVVGERSKVKAQTQRIYQMRATAFPDTKGAASRIFKDTVQATARRIIDQLGLRGVSRGGARISETHAEFIINEGKATGEDVFELSDLIRRKALIEKGLELEYEIDLWRDEPYRDPDEN